MPHIATLGAREIRDNFNDTGLADPSVGYHPALNTIVLSDEFIKRLNKPLPIVTKDICIALIIAHEFGHALVNQMSQRSLKGKSVEHMCDMIAGFTLRKMEEMDLLDEEDKETSKKMFHTMGIFDTGTHGGPDERLTAFLHGYKMSDEDIRAFLARLMPSYQVLEGFQRKILSSLNQKIHTMRDF